MITHEFKTNDLFVTQKAGDILFDGYKDKFTSNIGFVERLVARLAKLGIHLSIDSPSAISEDGYFSLLGQKNNSDYGLWTINTGKDNLTQLGKLTYLNGKE
jgi:hypothetical protein